MNKSKTQLIILIIVLSCLLSQFNNFQMKTNQGSVKSEENKDKSGKEDDDRVITVTGKAQTYTDAELITIGISATSLKNDASAALKANTENSNSTFKALNDIGVPNKNITTTSFSINAQYDYPYNEKTRTSDKVFRGYEVKNSVQITLTNLDLVGKAIDAAINGGANEITSVNFIIPQDKQNEIRKSLLQQAAKNAEDQAKLVADALKLQVKSVKSVNINDDLSITTNPAYYSSGASFSSKAADSAPTIFGSNGSSTSVSVNVVFVIGKK